MISAEDQYPCHAAIFYSILKKSQKTFAAVTVFDNGLCYDGFVTKGNSREVIGSGRVKHYSQTQ